VADTPPSVIYFIGDGMGMEYLAVYRHFADDPTTEAIEPTLFDRYLVGTAATHPHGHELVTDSAASATALSAGVKTYNGAIGVDRNQQPVETLLERAKKLGYQTAMVATSHINHATPASFAAHVKSRQQYQDIADQYLDNRIDGKPWVDVLIGGGQQYFKRQDRDLVKGFTDLGYQYADSFAALAELERAPVLALLAAQGLPYALDGAPANRLEVMTRKALALLPQSQPFFLLVEASEIDWCGHDNDIACAMAEMRDAEAALKVLADYTHRHGNSVLVMTADHSTGGLSMGANGKYQWHASKLHNIKGSGRALVKRLMAAGDQWPQMWHELTAISLSQAQQQTLAPMVKAATSAEASSEQSTTQASLRRALLEVINNASATGWTTEGHTGGDVPVMATGVNAQQFAGHQDNTAIARKLFTRLQPVE
jgi:alkaline phosphatase